MISRIVRRGGEAYYSVSAATDAIRALQPQAAAVVGLEGFRITASSTEPLMDYIAHWPELPRQPWDSYVERCATYGLQVLADWEREPPDHFMVSLAIDYGPGDRT